MSRRSRRERLERRAARLGYIAGCCNNAQSQRPAVAVPRGGCDQIFERAATHDSALVRARAAADPRCPPPLRLWLRDDSAATVRWAPSAHAAAATIAKDPDPRLRRVAAQSEHTAAGVLAALAADPDPETARTAAANPHIASAALTAATISTDERVRAAAAANPTVSVLCLRNLAGDPHDIVRRAVATNPRSEPDMLRTLIGDAVGNVAAAAATNPSIDADVLVEAARDGRWVAEVASNPNTPPDLLDKLGSGRCVHISEEACPDNGDCWSEHSDSREEILTAVFANPGTDPELLRNLEIYVEDWEYETQTAIAASETNPLWLDELVDYPEPQVRLALACNPHTTSETLQRLAQAPDSAEHDYSWVRDAVAEHPSCPPQLLTEMITGRDPIRSAAANPSCPPQTLADIATGDLGSVLAGYAAQNPSTPPQTLTDLSGHRSEFIRSAVAANPSTPPFTIAELATSDPGADTLVALARRALRMPQQIQ